MASMEWKCDVCHAFNEWNDNNCFTCLRAKKISAKFIKPVNAPAQPIPLHTADWKTPDAQNKHGVPASMRLRRRDPDTQADVSTLLKGDTPATVAAQTRVEPYTGALGRRGSKAAQQADQSAPATKATSPTAQPNTGSDKQTVIQEGLDALVPDSDNREIAEEVEILSMPWSRRLTSVAETTYSGAKSINPLDVDWDNISSLALLKTVLGKVVGKLHSADPQSTINILSNVPGLQEALAPPPPPPVIVQPARSAAHTPAAQNPLPQAPDTEIETAAEASEDRAGAADTLNAATSSEVAAADENDTEPSSHGASASHSESGVLFESVAEQPEPTANTETKDEEWSAGLEQNAETDVDVSAGADDAGAAVEDSTMQVEAAAEEGIFQNADAADVHDAEAPVDSDRAQSTDQIQTDDL